jgi:high affinity Mn2+ porin
MRLAAVRHGAVTALCLALAHAALAQQSLVDPPSETSDISAPQDAERFAVHGQATFLEQLTAPFHAPYAGPNSLTPRQGAEDSDMTLFLGARLWSGAEAWINPEIDQGFGLDDTLGLAGFPSGTAYKVGRSHPYWRLPRVFIRQTINLGGETSAVDADANQLAGSQSANRWVFTLGKFAVTDVFDSNQYAHDPRIDFLNWAAVDAGTFDYAADSWGFSMGATAEWYEGAWTLRTGMFDLSDVPNSETLDAGFHEFQSIAEMEHRHEFMGLGGKLLVTAYESYGRMAVLNEVVDLAQSTGESMGAALVAARGYRDRTGVSLSLEQQLGSDLGLFIRAGKASGNVEAYEFTDIDRAFSAGLSLNGKRWSRADDTLGLAVMDEDISAARVRFLNAGGLGILVGDGQLPHPGAEQILETYYRWVPVKWGQLTLDYQYVVNPAYNSDRGPVSIFALRLHLEF